MREEVVLERDVDVTAIPYGDRISLQKGHPVIITQALGGSYTLVTMQGYMVRLDGPDADAIGKEPQAPPTAEEVASKSLGDLVWDQLRTCYDPEIPVNIVELGLVHSAEVTDLPEGGKKVAVQRLAEVKDVDVQGQLDPPWDQTKMSDAARLQLGLM